MTASQVVVIVVLLGIIAWRLSQILENQRTQIELHRTQIEADERARARRNLENATAATLPVLWARADAWERDRLLNWFDAYDAYRKRSERALEWFWGALRERLESDPDVAQKGNRKVEDFVGISLSFYRAAEDHKVLNDLEIRYILFSLWQRRLPSAHFLTDYDLVEFGAELDELNNRYRM